MKRVLFALVTLLLPAAAYAQMKATPPITMNDAMGQFWSLEGMTTADGAVAIGTYPALTATITQTNGTVSAASTFQTALAASTARRGCVVQNTSTATEYVSVNASPTEAASRQLAAGAVYQCASSQAIEITSGTAAAAFEVESW